MNYYSEENGVRIFTALTEIIDVIIERKLKNDQDYKKRFKTPLLDEINKKYKDNPYGLDINMIPVRLMDRNKQTAYGWKTDASDNIININTGNDMLLLQRKNLYDITKQYIMTRYAKSCTPRSMFMRIIGIVEEYKNQLLMKESTESDYDEEESVKYSESDAEEDYSSYTEYNENEYDII